ncbi:MAG: MucR family transcriptional regulator [Rhizobiaceae bacterium]|nr:MucR family transcriptional regulator [Rhizobiaceae bacterium]
MPESSKLQQSNFCVQITSDIVSAYVSNHDVNTSELTDLIQAIHETVMDISETGNAAAHGRNKPAIDIDQSIHQDYLICLEDGKQFKSLKRHLMTHYNLTPEEYREKWGLPADYPMVAPAYAKARSQLAKQMGLGQKRA